jgi:surface protein
MFAYCLKLEKLDISSFKTYNLIDASYMFVRCLVLTSIDASNFDTEIKLKELDKMHSILIKDLGGKKYFI